MEHLKGEALLESLQVVISCKSVKHILTSCRVALEKLDGSIQRISERKWVYRLCHHFDLTPFVLNKEVHHSNKNEMKGKFLGIVLDGTTHLNEASAIVI